jgi:hypothetical protein
MPTNEQQVLSIRAWCFADRKGLLTPSTPFGVSAGHITSFRVVSRRPIQRFRRSRVFLERVRFPAAPQTGPLISGPFSLDHPLSRVSAHISGQQLAVNAIP